VNAVEGQMKNFVGITAMTLKNIEDGYVAIAIQE